MRQRGKVAARAQRSFGGNPRRHLSVQHLDQQTRDLRPDARVATGEHVGAEQHHRADDLDGQRLTDADETRQDEIARELPRLVRLDTDARERAKAGIYAVDGRLVAGDGLGNPALADLHTLDDLGGVQRDGRMLAGDGYDVLDSERVAGKLNHGADLSREESTLQLPPV